jgi:hypothetical protein
VCAAVAIAPPSFVFSSSILFANHRSAARTAMPDLQLGIRVDAKRRERAFEYMAG